MTDETKTYSSTPQNNLQFTARHNTTANNDHQASALMHFNNDIIATITAIDDVAMNWHFEIHGTKGNLKMITNPWWPEKTNNRILLTTDESKEISIDASQSLFTYQVNALCKKISGEQCDSYITMQDSRGNAAALRKWRDMALRETVPF